MLTVGTMLNGAFALIRDRIAAVGVWALIYFAITVAVTFVMRPFMLDLIALQGHVASNGALPPGQLPPGFGQQIGRIFLIYLALLAVLLVLYTAALRAQFDPENGAFAYLRVGMDELRVLGVAIVLGIAFFVLYLMLVLAMVVVGVVVTVAAHALAIPAAILAVVVVIGVLVYFQVRFSLAFALTLLRGRMVLAESWQLTRGRFWTLFGGYLVLGLIVLAMSVGLVLVTQGTYLSDMLQAGLDPAARALAQQHQLERQFVTITPLTMLGWALGAILGAGWIALGAGAVGSATLAALDEDYGDVATGHADPVQ